MIRIRILLPRPETLKPIQQRAWRRRALLAIGLAIGSFGLVGTAWSGSSENALSDLEMGQYCSATSNAGKTACRSDAKDDFWVGIGNCANLSKGKARKKCLAEVEEAREEELGSCREVFRTRQRLCRNLGQAAYDPAVTAVEVGDTTLPRFIPKNFPKDPAQSDATANPYFPLVPGRKWVYQMKEDGEVVEQVTVTVEDEIKNIGGVNCITVRDIAQEGEGEDLPVVEDTDDWYAQDFDGNVWYCGEISLNYEIFEEDPDPQVELVDVDGSWKAFRDSAKPGITMLANPQVGDIYRQEFALGDAEDYAKVVGLAFNKTVPAHSCSNDCMATDEFASIEPEVHERKFYAPGIGLILEVDLVEGGQVKLVEFTP